MLVILLRTVIMYAALLLIMRLMGKRQLGQLEITDLVTTVLISEIASMPLTDGNIPLHHALLPIGALACLEMGMSVLLLRHPLCKRMLVPRPTLLICHGVPDRKAMKRAKLSCEELLSQLRLQGIIDPADVDYAVMEPNGRISVIQGETSSGRTPSALMRLLISDGTVNRDNLRLVGRDEAWLGEYLRREGLRPREVFILLSDGKDACRLYPIRPRSGEATIDLP